ncbi:hypothetical protein D3C80_1046630 [compost metagenome]
MQEVRAEVGGAVTIDQHFDANPASGRLDQHILQLLTDLVFENDEGFQQNFFAGLADGFEHAGEVFLAVDQQLHLVAVAPLLAHNRTSTARGTWSDKCDQGLRDSARGSWAVALRR